MSHPIQTVRKICAETGVSAEDMLAALLFPHTIAHQQIRGFNIDNPAAQKFTIVDHVKDQLKTLGLPPDQPGSVLQLLSLFTMGQHGVLNRYADSVMQAAAGEQVAVAKLLRDLINQAEEEGWQNRESMNDMMSPKPWTARDDKFADFDRLIRESKANGITEVIVAFPQVLGDTYAELVTNLNKLADAELKLVIVPQKERK